MTHEPNQITSSENDPESSSPERPPRVKSNQRISNRLPTGIPGLDAITGGGLPRNYVYLIQGDPGSGKTTMALQFLLEGARHGETSLYITLSESAEELRQVAVSHGWDLDGVTIFEPPLAKSPFLPEDENTLFHPSEIELAETMKVLLQQIVDLRPQRLVLDSLSEIRLLAQTPLRYRRQILALKQYLAGYQTTVILLDDRTYTDDIQMQSVPSGVIELFHNSPDLWGRTAEAASGEDPRCELLRRLSRLRHPDRRSGRLSPAGRLRKPRRGTGDVHDLERNQAGGRPARRGSEYPDEHAHHRAVGCGEIGTRHPVRSGGGRSVASDRSSTSSTNQNPHSWNEPGLSEWMSATQSSAN